MSKSRIYLGKTGEDLAVKLLKERGYKILKRNYKTKLGEIDIVASDRDTIAFIEVKTRQSERYGLPQEAISSFKQRQIAKAALCFLKENKFLDRSARFDVVSVICTKDKPRLDLLQNAFDLNSDFTY